MKIHIIINDQHKNTRLDTVISTHIKDCSRSRAADLINDSRILVNKAKKKPAFRVNPGDVISGSFSVSGSDSRVLPENIHLDIQFEDDYILVVNKKPGMVVHPAPGNTAGTLVNALLFHEPGIEGVGEDLSRPGIVHRLDKDTSGLIVVAKTQHALHFLQKEFKCRRVEKRYLALVYGNLPGDRGEIDLPIGRHPVKRKIMAIRPDKGKPALTCWKVVERFKTACLVDVLLKTGRTHQIRVHFYAIDHPLIGDFVYQHRRYRKKKTIAQRQMLHSWQLSFRHPYSAQRVCFKAPVPEDFLQTQALLESLKKAD